MTTKTLVGPWYERPLSDFQENNFIYKKSLEETSKL